MPPERIQVVAVLYLMASLSLCSPQLCLAQGNIYSGRVVSQDPNSISLNLKPCGTQRLQTVSPYKTMGNPTQASCPNATNIQVSWCRNCRHTRPLENSPEK